MAQLDGAARRQGISALSSYVQSFWWKVGSKSACDYRSGVARFSVCYSLLLVDGQGQAYGLCLAAGGYRVVAANVRLLDRNFRVCPWSKSGLLVSGTGAPLWYSGRVASDL